MQLVLHTYGLALKCKQNAFFVTDGKESRRISPAQLDSIAVISPCLISSAAIELAAREGVPIFIFDERGDLVAALRSPYFESLATLRRKQVYFSDQVHGAQWIVEQFRVKTQLQMALLEKLMKRRRKKADPLQKGIDKIRQHLQKLEDPQSPPSPSWANALMGWEGALAKNYWRGVNEVMPEDWTFEKRSRRPAEDAFNATINYLYAFLYGTVEQALFGAGLDPHLGILHADEYDRPTLAYDLIEPFRPWIDELVTDRILRGEPSTAWYEAREQGIFLNRAGKRFWIPAYNEWMATPVRWESRQMTRKAHIFRRADELARRIRETVNRPV